MAETEYEVPYDGTATELYAGRVTVNLATFEQATLATAAYTLRWPDVEVSTTATMDVTISAESLDVTIELVAREATDTGPTTVATRRWHETISAENRRSDWCRRSSGLCWVLPNQAYVDREIEFGPRAISSEHLRWVAPQSQG